MKRTQRQMNVRSVFSQTEAIRAELSDRLEEQKACFSMSPTVPPMLDEHETYASRETRGEFTSLISLVMCGMT